MHPCDIQEFDPYVPSTLPSSAATFYKKMMINEDHLSNFVGAINAKAYATQTPSPYLDNSLLKKSFGMPSSFMPRRPSVPQPLRPPTSRGAPRRCSRIRRAHVRLDKNIISLSLIHYWILITIFQTLPVTSPKLDQTLDQIHSNVKMTLLFTGRNSNLEGPLRYQRSQVMVLQQHCGGNTLTVFNGSIGPKGIIVSLFIL